MHIFTVPEESFVSLNIENELKSMKFKSVTVYLRMLFSRFYNSFTRATLKYVLPCLFYLFATVDAVLAEDGSAACGHPDSGQCVAVNLVLFNHPLAFLVLKHKAESAVKKNSHNPSNNLSGEGGFSVLYSSQIFISACEVKGVFTT